MKHLIAAALVLAAILLPAVVFAADVKPLVNASGQVRPAHTGETVGVANGGTGATSLSSHCVVIGQGTSAATTACPSTLGYVLTDNGSGSNPSFQAAASGSGTVTTTGSPVSGNLAKFSGSTSVTSGDLSGDCTTSGTLAITCTKTSGTSLGTFATQNYATPPAIGGTTPAAGAFTTLSATSNLTTNVTGSTQCLQANSSGVVSGTGSACGSGGGGSGTVTSVACGPTTITTTGACSGLLVGIQRITATGSFTYTPDAGTNSIIIELLGAGGGGSGVASPGGTNVYISAGGCSGEWARKRVTSNFSGATGSVGAKGTGGAAGNNNGNTGGDTTFTTTGGSPVTYTAKGGGGGSRNGPFAAPFISGVASCTSSSTGDDNSPSAPGSVPIAVSTNNNIGASGGSSPYGLGGFANTLGGTNTSAAGNAGNGKGAGGGGAVATGTGAAKAGGDGTDGEVIIWEFSRNWFKLPKPANDTAAEILAA